MQIIFIVLIAIVFYSYFGYAILLQGLVFIKKIIGKKKNINHQNLIHHEDLPFVSLVIPAYNEKEIIDAKMKNTFDLNYPKDKLKIVWVTDGSNDEGDKYLHDMYIRNYSHRQIYCYHQEKREGKSAAINRVMNFIDTDIVVFCDANTFLNKDSIINIVKHFEDKKVGGVAGEKRVLRNDSTVGEGESFYWKYESWVKKLNSEFYTCIGMVGELMAFRKNLFKTIPNDTILDDFVISMEIATQGYKVIYEENAYAEEAPSQNEKEEMKRKIRIAAGAFQCMFRYIKWLNFFKHFILSFQYFSHKVSRWVIVPFALPLILILNIYLFFKCPQNTIYAVFLFLQFLIYFMTLIQHYATLSSKIFRWTYYVVMMNMSMYKGFWRYITKQQSAAWEKVRRV